MNLSKTWWGNYDEQNVFLYRLDNGQMSVSITNFGAIITRIDMPDRNGNLANIVLGFDDLQHYIDDQYYTGCLVGRFAGRICNAEFAINGQHYPLAQNEGNKIHIHGGNMGFGKKVFTFSKQEQTNNFVAVELYYRSADMEEGYPGNLDVWVTYRLTANNRFEIEYRALTDKATHINLTNHSYFNLSGNQRNILDHRLTLDADHFLVNNEYYLPTGQISQVANTPYSFKQPKLIIEGIKKLGGNGYNECYVLNNAEGSENALLYDEASGRQLSLYTNSPALIFYTGDYLNGSFGKNSGVCLETQYYPDAPNHANFPSTLLKPGQQWQSKTAFNFNWK